MTPAAVAMALTLAVVLLGYGSWRLPRLRGVLLGAATALGAVLGAVVLGRRPGGERRASEVALDVVDERAEQEIERIADADADGLAELVNAGSREHDVALRMPRGVSVKRRGTLRIAGRRR